MDDRDIFIVGAARTAIGDFGGALKDVQPDELGRIVAVAAMERAAVAPADVQHVVIGQVIQSGPRDAYIARVIGVNAGIPVEAPALTLNRLCGSGLQAIISAAQTLKLGEADIALAGGTESMSNSPHVVKAARFGTKMGDIKMIDAMLEVLSDPFEHFHMGITAENVAEKYQVSRAAQDALAVEGHSRAARAIVEGRFKEQIVPVEVKSRKGVVTFDTDEHVRADASLEEMAKLKPAFRKEGGTVTPGNASGINDGAGAVVVASGKAVAEKGLKPLARILGWGHAGVDPRIMGVGPIKAVPIALERAGVTLDQIDVIEANEAFAAQACAVAKELGFDPEKVNPNGSGIALGHPVGATGAILTVKTAYELKRTGGKYGLITMCIGGGQGIAMVIENVA
ncbi:acetyl-CoA C-acetyltransferase [Sphingobium wenxiniae]|uniref:Acetyl-CoA C-acetyltransferase n=1 Tax=Sphingobium wenxiniae (strain DSM 21828 / CGMCC 1.7748 / JZ-1) TaxID=595605 RepID=A0A562KQR9_SPHWJ|nr:beta-ketothiolase BktB [Sphingobium wenxiniae]MBB6190142.1 acetyl-CoA C-acetyltransferase [Sphingobium wenxiniae]TWH97543.1 acetyl-CoA C-acetyltransferase [Sphingobium wenxiniae]